MIYPLELVEAGLFQQAYAADQTSNSSCCVCPPGISEKKNLIAYFEIICEKHVRFGNIFIQAKTKSTYRILLREVLVLKLTSIYQRCDSVYDPSHQCQDQVGRERPVVSLYHPSAAERFVPHERIA